MKTTFTLFRTGIVALVLLLNAGYASAKMDDLNIDDDFKYTTRRTISVSVQVNTPVAGPVGLSFYTEGKNGLRLLFSTLTDELGHYQGQLSLPAASKTMIVKSRWVNDFKKTRLNIKNNAVCSAINYKKPKAAK